MVAPIRKRGNLLLCTLLIGNTIANCALPRRWLLGLPARLSSFFYALCRLCGVLVCTGLSCTCQNSCVLQPHPFTGS